MVEVMEKLRHLPTRHEREIAAREHPIEARERAMNLVCVFLGKGLHDRPL